MSVVVHVAAVASYFARQHGEQRDAGRLSISLHADGIRQSVRFAVLATAEKLHLYTPVRYSV